MSSENPPNQHSEAAPSHGDGQENADLTEFVSNLYLKCFDSLTPFDTILRCHSVVVVYVLPVYRCKGYLATW